MTDSAAVPPHPASPADNLAWIHAARLVADDLPAEEAARLRAWLDTSADGQRTREASEAAWRAAEPLAALPPVAWDTAAALGRFRAARARETAGARRWGGWSSPRKTRAARYGAAVAAAAALVVGVRWAAKPGDATRVGAAAVVLVNAAGGVPRSERLADGTLVTLAPGSALDGARGFGVSHRTLRLTGEGAFTVAPGGHPFRVQLRDVVVEDLSTAFAVRDDGTGVVVAVTEGSVVVGAQRDTLRQGAAVRVDGGGALHPLEPAAVAREVAWTSGALVFDDAPVADIAARITRWSGRPVTVTPALAARRVTVAFQGERVEAMVQVLAVTLGARAEAAGTGWRLSEGAR